MREIKNPPKTGDVIARSGPGDDAVLTVAISLPVAIWEQLTLGLSHIYDDADDERKTPPLDLEQCIDLFLELETQEWMSRLSPKSLDNDLDDGVPF